MRKARPRPRLRRCIHRGYPPHDARADKGTCFDAAEQAQLARYHGDLVGARDKLMVCAQRECPPAVTRDCAQWLTDVTQALPSLAIHAQDNRGHDVIGAAVLIDGVRVATQLGGTSIPINPGAHKVRLETASGEVYEEEILVVEGQKERLLDAKFAAALNVNGARAAPPPPIPARPLEPVAGGGHGIDALVLGLAVVGLTGVALGTYLEVAGQQEYSALKSGCGVSGTCTQSALGSAKEKLFGLAPVGVGVGVVSLGFAAGLFFLGHRPAPPASTATWDLEVAPRLGGGAVGAISHRF